MKRQSRRIALCGLLCALAEVCLLLGGLIPAALYCCPILAMAALLPVREEYGAKAALTAWAAAAILAILLVSDKELAGVYASLGWYPAAQPALNRIRWVPGRALCKLAIFSAATAALYGLLLFVFQLRAVAEEFAASSPWMPAVLAALGCAVFFLTDRMLDRLARLWRGKLRRRWFPGV